MASVAQRESGGWGGARARAETWSEFDGLPRGLKRAYWDAPYDYTAITTVEAMARGRDPRRIAQTLYQSHAADLRREVLRLYGPEHPQAGAAE